MESRLHLKRFSQSTYPLNLLSAKAQSSIKRHEVKGFINAGQGFSKIPLILNDENSQLGEHLMQLKTSCSVVRLDIKLKQMEQFKYKEQASQIADRAKGIQEDARNLQEEIRKMTSIVQQVSQKKASAVHTTKSYEHILDRMKKDQIRAQMRRNQLEWGLGQLEKQLKELTGKAFEIKEYELLSSCGVKEAQEEAQELSSFRKQTLADMGSILKEKQVLERKEQQRQEKSQMIKEMAAGDLQDADLIRMKKFLTAQTFLKALLKSKMEKLKDFYSPYELAFLKIKSNTNVKDAATLISEFRGFQSNYTERSQWVKHLQKEINSLQEQKRRLEKERTDVRIKEMQILEQLQENNKDEVTPLNRELQAKADQLEIMEMSVREWLKLQAKKIKMDTSNKSDITLLKDICEQLKKKKQPS